MKKLIKSTLSVFLLLVSLQGLAAAQYCFQNHSLRAAEICHDSFGNYCIYPQNRGYYTSSNSPQYVRIYYDGWSLLPASDISPSSYVSDGGILAPQGQYLVQIMGTLENVTAQVLPYNPSNNGGKTLQQYCAW